MAFSKLLREEPLGQRSGSHEDVSCTQETEEALQTEQKQHSKFVAITIVFHHQPTRLEFSTKASFFY